MAARKTSDATLNARLADVLVALAKWTGTRRLNVVPTAQGVVVEQINNGDTSRYFYEDGELMVEFTYTAPSGRNKGKVVTELAQTWGETEPLAFVGGERDDSFADLYWEALDRRTTPKPKRATRKNPANLVTNLSAYNATSLSDFAEYKREMRAITDEAAQAFSPPGIVTEKGWDRWSVVVDEVEHDRAMATASRLPQYGEKATIFLYTTVSARRDWGVRKGMEPQWAVEIRPWAIDNVTVWKTFARFVKPKKHFFEATNPVDAMKHFEAIKKALVASAKALKK